MKDSTDMHICGLEMEGGYHGHPYPQKFVKAPAALHPPKSPNSGKEVSASEVMKATLC